MECRTSEGPKVSPDWHCLELTGLAEDSTLEPTNPYSAAKAGAEMIAKAYMTSYRLPVITTRSNNVYGPKQFPEKLIGKFTLLASRNEDLPIHGNGKPACLGGRCLHCWLCRSTSLATAAIRATVSAGSRYICSRALSYASLYQRTPCHAFCQPRQTFNWHVLDALELEGVEV